MVSATYVFSSSEISVVDCRCTLGPGDRPFPEVHRCFSLAYVRKDLAAHDEYCGLFRVPSLRNVAVRRVFFHNGAFDRLERVMAFYVERDINPAKWYRKAGGHVEKYCSLNDAISLCQRSFPVWASSETR